MVFSICGHESIMKSITSYLAKHFEKSPKAGSSFLFGPKRALITWQMTYLMNEGTRKLLLQNK